ncbi:MAG: MBL fold metallo-hydrolase [Candidatus Methanomethyliaceae archaeon]|nr:MBL fold metallo-hydrolase [Candidatus Methanomethyliaceae archaeon]
MKVTVFGGGKEVGRSGFEIRGESTKFVLDYGVMIREDRPVFPLSTHARDLDGVIITHAHLDHSGGAPIFYVTENPRIFMTSITKELTDILVKDLLHLSSYFLPYEALELRTMIDRTEEVGNKARIGNAEVEFYSAGHIPGSINVLLSLEGKKIWYSGDFNTIDTALLRAGTVPETDMDFAIIESTYATVDHPPRDESERRLVEVLNDVVEGGGLALIPAFSVGRSQEILCVLQKHGFKYDIAIDGMSRVATRLIASAPETLRDPKLLKKAMSRVKWVAGQKDRDKVLNKPGVVITSSGMLTGGASVYYMEKIRNRSRDCVVLVSFQIPGTPGRLLLDEGVYGPPGERKKVKCRVEWIDFSSHCGKTELMKVVKSIKGNPKILCVHGEPVSCTSFAEHIRQETGLEAYAPSLGDSFTF